MSVILSDSATFPGGETNSPKRLGRLHRLLLGGGQCYWQCLYVIIDIINVYSIIQYYE